MRPSSMEGAFFIVRQLQHESRVTGLFSPHLEHFQTSVSDINTLTNRADKPRTLSWYASADKVPIFKRRVVSAVWIRRGSSDGSTLTSYPQAEHLKSIRMAGLENSRPRMEMFPLLWMRWKSRWTSQLGHIHTTHTPRSLSLIPKCKSSEKGIIPLRPLYCHTGCLVFPPTA